MIHFYKTTEPDLQFYLFCGHFTDVPVEKKNVG